MSTKQIIIAIIIALVVGLAVGRFSLPAKVVIKTETVEVDKKQSQTDSNKQDHSITTVTEVKHPDGSITKTTVIKNDVDLKVDSHSTQQKDIDTKSSKETTYNTARWTISALAVTRPFSNPYPPTITYGGSVMYRILGPIQIGGLGLSDGTVGASLGISF